jgi:hypothetical protein
MTQTAAIVFAVLLVGAASVSAQMHELGRWSRGQLVDREDRAQLRWEQHNERREELRQRREERLQERLQEKRDRLRERQEYRRDMQDYRHDMHEFRHELRNRAN